MDRKPHISELIKIAKANKDKILQPKWISEELNEPTRFVLAFDIKQGKNKVLSEIIYKAYLIWSLDPLSKISFFRYFGQLFEKQKGQFKNYYLINYKPAELVNEAMRMKEK